MKNSIFRCLTIIALSVPAAAQQPGGSLSITLKDGKVFATPTLSRSGNNIMATVAIGPGMGQIGYPVGSIERIDFPEPPQLKTARDLLAQGKTNEALIAIAPIVTYFAPYRDVPGNFWAESAILKLNALVAARRETEADTLIDELERSSKDPEAVRMVKVQQAASWARKGQDERALAVYDEAIKQSADRATLATAWLNKGHSLLALKKWESAVLAYLRIPVFYADRKLLVPAALLGSARALEGLQDNLEAQAKLNELIQDYPDSPEAASAKQELEKLKKQQS